jgi:hypothetical protein
MIVAIRSSRPARFAEFARRGLGHFCSSMYINPYEGFFCRSSEDHPNGGFPEVGSSFWRARDAGDGDEARTRGQSLSSYSRGTRADNKSIINRNKSIRIFGSIGQLHANATSRVRQLRERFSSERP